ncbi:MAG TPA: DNA internalization-related competence protein ComEC/Rec2 [Vicinamibacterales bacterium]|nr:DNA internalization-related competence protein ComEC/Rec2 [Vicinamibacterales bacterium]
MRYPAALPAIALGTGIAAGIFLHASVPFPVLILLWLISLAAFLQHRQRLATACLFLGFVACGVCLGARADILSRATPLLSLFNQRSRNGEEQLFGVIAGRLRTDAARGPSGVTLSLDVETVTLDGVRYLTRGGALVGVGGELAGDQIPQWRAGRRVQFPATLRRPSKYLDPGVPDSERLYAWRGTSLVGSVKSDRLVELVARGDALAESLASTRAAIRRAMASAVAPWSTRSAAITTAILVGDRAGLDEEVERKLQEAGTYHVIAISGGNIAILAGLCLVASRVARVGPRLAALLIILMLSAYAMVVEGGSSVARATLMAVIYFAARMGDHATRAGNVAALAAALLFCLQPLQIVDAGFALTFGATLGIIIGMSGLGTLATLPRWLQPAAALLAASLCAEIALMPISAFVFSRVTFAGLLANFAAIPLMTVVQVAGMAAAALAGPFPAVALWAGRVAHWAVEGLIGSAALVDFLPWLTRRLSPPAPWVVAGYYLALVWALASRRFLPAVPAAALAVWIVAAPNVTTVGVRLLRVTFLDVGQGDAAIVQFPDGRTLSVDAGGLPGGTFDIGSRVVSPAFWALGVRRLDYMSITHGDQDHIGGAMSVYRDFEPFELWEGVPVPPHKPTRELKALADTHGTVWRTLRSDDKVSFGAVDLFVRHPPRPDWERQRVRNNDSEVIELRYGGVSFVFTGDIGREVEQEISSSFDRVPIRILKVPHHGSATSSSKTFLDALRPDIAVISAGRGNTFGHPVPSVVERYRSIGAAIYRTDHDGAVSIETDGITVRVRTFTNRRLTLRTHGR